MSTFERIVVLGAGAWGTALALTAARAGRDVTLWARDPQLAAEISYRHRNTPYLPDVEFDVPLKATTDLSCVTEADAILFVTPAQSTREIADRISADLKPGTPIILCAKGIERETGELLTDVLQDVLPKARPTVLSGPSFAADVARDLPTAVTIAAEEPDLADALCVSLAARSFRPYASTDLIGVQVGGALKNVLAIACGAVVGHKLGASAQAALTARGFAELSRLGASLGARPETLTGLSGLGDLVLTCSSTQSRNFSFGIQIGEGRSADDILAAGGKLAEGVFSARIAVELGKRHKVPLPICKAVSHVLTGEISVGEALTSLMSRPLKHETPST